LQHASWPAVCCITAANGSMLDADSSVGFAD
jgi:hypothetical protein